MEISDVLDGILGNRTSQFRSIYFNCRFIHISIESYSGEIICGVLDFEVIDVVGVLKGNDSQYIIVINETQIKRRRLPQIFITLTFTFLHSSILIH